MITADYFRRHAETCFQLARTVKDAKVAAKLIEMAEDFSAKAKELDTKPHLRGVRTCPDWKKKPRASAIDPRKRRRHGYSGDGPAI